MSLPADSDELLNIIREAVPERSETVRLGTVGVVNADGIRATVRFDGESAAGAKEYLSVNYRPVAGDRVALLRAGHSWIIIGKVGSTPTAAVHTHSSLSVPDKRSQAFTPQQYDDDGLNNGVRWEFISGTSLGLTSAFYGVATIAPWGDDSGGGLTQVAYGPSGVHTRYGTRAGGWGAWADMRSDSGWLELTTFHNGATPYQTGITNAWTPRYRKIGGVVYLQGLINTNATTNPLHVTTLPAGYRPRNTLMENIFVSGANYRRMDIDVNGSLVFREGNPAYSTGWHSISATFPADA